MHCFLLWRILGSPFAFDKKKSKILSTDDCHCHCIPGCSRQRISSRMGSQRAARSFAGVLLDFRWWALSYFVMSCFVTGFVHTLRKRYSFFKSNESNQWNDSAQELFICGHTTPDRNEAVILAQAWHLGAPGCSIVVVYTLDSRIEMNRME